MPEQERQIEKLLKAYADKRRGEAKEGFPLHPATRNMLLAEVKRKYHGGAASTGFSFSAMLQKYWKPFGFAFSVLIVLAMVLVALNPPGKDKEAQMAMRSAGANNDFLDRRTEAAEQPQNTPAKPGSAPMVRDSEEQNLAKSERLDESRQLKDLSMDRNRSIQPQSDAKLRREDEVLLADKQVMDAPATRAPPALAATATPTQPDPVSGPRATSPTVPTPAETPTLGLAVKADGAGAFGGGAEPQSRKSTIGENSVLREKAQLGYDALSAMPQQKGTAQKGTEKLSDNQALFFRNNLDGVNIATVTTTTGGDAFNKDSSVKKQEVDNNQAGRSRFQNDGRAYGVEPAPQGGAKAKVQAPAVAGAAGALPPAPILNSFFVVQDGDQVRIIDEDGSVYDGKLGNADVKTLEALSAGGAVRARNATRGVEVTKKEMKTVPAQQVQYPFVAAGTNVLSRQSVVINGVIYAPLETNVSQVQNEVNKRILSESATRSAPADNNAKSQVQDSQLYKNQTTPLQLHNISQIQGTARIGASNELKVNATRANQ